MQSRMVTHHIHDAYGDADCPRNGDASHDVLAPQATRPKELDRLRSLKHEFDRVSELVASSAAIVAGEARFWDGVMWASAISDGTSLSAENRRCLRKYAEKIEKIEAKYKAARRLVEDVIITLTTERESL